MSLAEQVQKRTAASKKIAKGLETVPRILTLDIETSPSVVYTWGRFKQNIGLNQVVEDGRILCFAAKWYSDPNVLYFGENTHTHEEMIAAAHELLSDADITIGYNHKSFDLKHFRREFMLAGMTPPSPTSDVDLLTVVKGTAKYESNKLDNIATRLGLGSKVKHEGFDLWKSCLNGDKAAWKRMQTYCIGDVKLTEKLYDELRPWIRNHPHIGFYANADAVTCNRCGSKDLKRNGTYTAQVIRYVRYECGHCGSWVRGGVHSRQAVTRGIA